MSDKIRKYVLPNLPYLFVFWFFSKIGTAYRIAPGTDFGTKLVGMLDTFPKAFETYWPGQGGIDLLVGLAGAAGMYLLIQSKIRQAKKFRRDAEYGTARFGTKEDIKPFVDPKFQNNVILTGTEFLTMNTRPKIPANARNLNACVIGSSGSGKTRFWLTPQLLQAHSSYVVVDLSLIHIWRQLPAWKSLTRQKRRNRKSSRRLRRKRRKNPKSRNSRSAGAVPRKQIRTRPQPRSPKLLHRNRKRWSKRNRRKKRLQRYRPLPLRRNPKSRRMHHAGARSRSSISS